MQVPIEIAYHQISKSEAIDSLIREKMVHLEQFCDHITSCAVVVERPHLHERSGNPFRVRLDLHVPPGHEIVAVAGQQHNDMHDPLQTVVLDAFEKAERQLKALTERQRGLTKNHEPVAPKAVITQLNVQEGWGYITDPDGRDIFFERESVLEKDFAELQLGMSATFTEEIGKRGAQASTLRLAL